MIIGITGTIGAGKGTVVEYLKKRGFKHYSARAFITEEIKRRGLPINRDTMRETANDLRKMHGPGYIVESLYAKATAEGGDAVIESIRSRGDAEAIKQKPNAYLFAVDADPKIRYERIQKRASETDQVSFEKFLEQERKEMYATDPWDMNISSCMQLADYTFNNTKSIEGLEEQVDKALSDIAQNQNG